MQASRDALRTVDWYRTATRWSQLTLAENDPVKFDPDFWIDFFKRTQSNAVCLSAGGYIAFYPSEVPLHYVSKFLGDTDPFGFLVEGARKLGMHVMARVDPHAIHDDAAQAHPEWIAVDKSGQKRRHWAYPDVWVTCAYGDYNRVFMPSIVKEITQRYDIDAIFANRWQGHGVCYCNACHRRFKAASGHDLPSGTDVQDPAWRAWTEWRRDVLTAVIVEWDQDVKVIKPHASFIPNMNGASLMEFDVSLIEKHCPFLVVDDQGRRGVQPVWLAGRNGKRIRATFPERPVVLITSIGPEEEHRWKDAVTTGPEIQSWIMNGAVHGMIPWYTKFNGVVADDRFVAPIVDAYGIHAALEPVLGSMQPCAEVALIDPTSTLAHWAPDKREQAETNDLGFYHALIEAKIPFELLSDQAMTAASLDRFKVVILANAVCLSEAQCAALRDYVSRGGSLVAAYETSMQDETGKARKNFGLSDVFGASSKSATKGPIKNNYVALNGSHDICQGFDGATRIIGGTFLIDVEAVADSEAPLLFVPNFPDLPMEEVYAREEPHGAAVVAHRHQNGGRTVYFPWNIGGIFWDVLTADHGKLIANAVRWALGAEERLRVEGDGVLDIALHENADGMAIAIFNLTNPMMMKGPTRAIYPVGKHTVSLALRPSQSVARARLLVAGQNVDTRIVDGRAVVDIPAIGLLEVVHLLWK